MLRTDLMSSIQIQAKFMDVNSREKNVESKGKRIMCSLSTSLSLSRNLSWWQGEKIFFAKNNNFLKLILKGKTGSYRPTEGTTVTTKVRSIRKRDQTIKFSVFPVVHGPLLWAYGRLYYGRTVLKAAYKGQNQTDAGREQGRPWRSGFSEPGRIAAP